MVGVEDGLWLSLATALPCIVATSWQSLVVLGVSVACLLVDQDQLVSVIPLRGKERSGTAKLGLQMSVVMIPTLLQATIHHFSHSTIRWTTYSKLATLLVIPKSSISFILCSIAAIFDPAIETFLACLLMAVWFLLLPIFAKKFTKSFTFGELQSVSLVLLIISFEYANEMYERKYKSNHLTDASLYTFVALSGSFSCYAFAFLGNNLQMLAWWPKLIMNVAGPLLFVDVSLHTATNFTSNSSFLPLSIQWLVEFLTEKEDGLERYWGIVYWIIVLAVGSYPTFTLISVPSQNKPSVVVTRKWFHLIAILLFGPVTWWLPQLMSLSYAIAVCILVVLETFRADTPLLQSFYTAFIDDRKDDSGKVIISHIFLIIGCAAPLWLTEFISSRTESSSSSLSSRLVAEFGVLCIGVGDAMGAVIGKSIGRNKWGTNQRTLEGSFAMWLSMIVIGIFLCSSLQEYLALFVATTFTTILEAFTDQLDNLVLPLFGSSIILLMTT